MKAVCQLCGKTSDHSMSDYATLPKSVVGFGPAPNWIFIYDPRLRDILTTSCQGCDDYLMSVTFEARPPTGHVMLGPDIEKVNEVLRAAIEGMIAELAKAR